MALESKRKSWGDKFLKNFMQEALKEPSILLDTSDVIVDTEYFTNAG